MIECKLCGLRGESIVTHLKFKHNLSTGEYRIQFPIAPVMSDARKDKNKKSSISPASIDFWLIKTNGDLEKAKILLDENANKRSKSLKGKSPSSLTWWLKKFNGDIELAKIHRKDFCDNSSLDSFKKRYGEIEGTVKYDESISKRRKTSHFSYDSWVSMYGDSSETKDRYLESKSRSLQSSISRYGEREGTIRFDKWVSNCKNQSHRSLSYWLANTTSEKEARDALADFQRRDISWFKNKFGINWEHKRSEWIRKATSHRFNLKKRSISKQQIKLMEDFLQFTKYDIKNENIVPEYECVVDGYVHYIDFLIEVNGVKIAIEYNGDYWHANPNIYKSGTVIGVRRGIHVDEIWKRDQLRLDRIKKIFPVIVMWESDFKKNNHVSILEKQIVEVLNEYKKN